MSEEGEMDPIVSLGFILKAKLSRVAAIRKVLSGLEGVHIIVSRLGEPRHLWIKGGEEFSNRRRR